MSSVRKGRAVSGPAHRTARSIRFPSSGCPDALPSDIRRSPETVLPAAAILSAVPRKARALTCSRYTSSQGLDSLVDESSSAVEKLSAWRALMAPAREPCAEAAGAQRNNAVASRRSLVPVIIVSAQLARVMPESAAPGHSHSIVLGGLELMSYTTLLTPSTLLMISFDMFCRKSYGSLAQSAVIPSVLVTALRTAVFW